MSAWVTVVPKEPSCALVMCLLLAGLVNLSDGVLFLAVSLFALHPMSKVLSFLFQV